MSGTEICLLVQGASRPRRIGFLASSISIPPQSNINIHHSVHDTETILQISPKKTDNTAPNPFYAHLGVEHSAAIDNAQFEQMKSMASAGARLVLNSRNKNRITEALAVTTHGSIDLNFAQQSGFKQDRDLLNLVAGVNYKSRSLLIPEPSQYADLLARIAADLSFMGILPPAIVTTFRRSNGSIISIMELTAHNNMSVMLQRAACLHQIVSARSQNPVFFKASNGTTMQTVFDSTVGADTQLACYISPDNQPGLADVLLQSHSYGLAQGVGLVRPLDKKQAPQMHDPRLLNRTRTSKRHVPQN